jgi:hypothetical protein
MKSRAVIPATELLILEYANCIKASTVMPPPFSLETKLAKRHSRFTGVTIPAPAAAQ